MSIETLGNGSWRIDLGGICYREMWDLLEAIFDSYEPEVFLTDGINSTRSENE